MDQALASSAGPARPTYRFADFEVQPASGRILCAGQPIAIEPRAFELLLFLITHRERLVEKDEILTRVWDGSHVTDNALTRAIARLRRVLGDSARAPRFIETVHSRGYRFLATVEEVAEGEPAAGPPRRQSWARGVVVLVAAICLVGFLMLKPERTSSPPEGVAAAVADPDSSRVVVLPLQDLGAGSSSGYFADGLSEQLTSVLARIDGLRVVARTTAMAYRDDPRRLSEIALELGAGTVLEGSVQRFDGQLRVNVRLVDGTSEEPLWVGEFDREASDLFAVQSEIAVRVAEALRLSISPESVAAIRHGPTREVSAYEVYLRGRQSYRQYSRNGNEEAVVFFQRAIEIDPRFALSHAGLANAYALRAIRFSQGAAWQDEAITAAEQALELDPALPEAYKALGIVANSRDQIRRAVEYNRRALDIDPSYDEALYNLASALYELGRWDEAVRHQLRDLGRPIARGSLAIYLSELGLTDAAQRLAAEVLQKDPLTGYLVAYQALYRAEAGELDAARRSIEALRRAKPDWPRTWRISGIVELLAGEHRRALEYFEQALEIAFTSKIEARLRVAQVHWLLGRNAEAEALFTELRGEVEPKIAAGSEWWFHPWLLAAVESMRGNPELAIEWYQRAIDAGHRRYRSDAIDSVFKPLRGHSGFESRLAGIEREVETMRLSVATEVEAVLGL